MLLCFRTLSGFDVRCPVIFGGAIRQIIPSFAPARHPFSDEPDSANPESAALTSNAA